MSSLSPGIHNVETGRLIRRNESALLSAAGKELMDMSDDNADVVVVCDSWTGRDLGSSAIAPPAAASCSCTWVEAISSATVPAAVEDDAAGGGEDEK